MDSTSTSFADDLRSYLGLVRHFAWLLILAIVLCGGAAYLVSIRSTPIYQAVTTVLINQAPSVNTNDYTAIVTSERLAQTYSQLMTKQPVLQGVLQRLNLSLDPAVLKKAITVQPVTNTTLIEVRVEDADPQRAAAIANALVEEFAAQNEALQASRYAESKASLLEQLNQMDTQIQAASQSLAKLENTPENQPERDRLEANLAQYRQTYAYILQSYEQVRLAEAQSTSNVIQAEPATTPQKPVRPRTVVNTILGVVIGLLLALGGIFLVEALDDTLKNPEQVNRELGLPILGLIAHHGNGDDSLVTQLEPRSLVAEAFRTLRSNIQFAQAAATSDQPLRTLLVTSPSPAEGKSTVAANLAVVLAQSGRKVALLDADLRRPRLHKILNLSNRNGISDLFVQETINLDGTLAAAETQGLVVMTSGNTPPNPAELLGSEKMVEILNRVAEQAEMIILDSPPVMAVTDSAVLAQHVDGVLLVLKPYVTQMGAARQTVEQMQRAGARLLGVVLNQVDLKNSRYNYYYRSYYAASYHYYGRDEKPRNGRSAKKS